MQYTNTNKILLGATALLLIPLAASQFVDGWLWSPFDYVFAWVMFAGTGLLFNFVVSRYKNADKDYRLGVGVALLAAFLLVWSNLAVGFIGSEDNQANIVFFIVLLLGGAAALLSGFERQRMAYAMFLTAALQALAPAAAYMIWSPSVTDWHPGVFHIYLLNGFFVFLWLMSALLFKGGRAIDLIGWVFGAGVFMVGVINTVWGNDMGFGIFLVLLSSAYLPPVAAFIESRIGFSVPRILKIALAVFIMWAAVGVGELFDKIDLMLASLGI